MNEVEKLWQLQSLLSALNEREKKMAVKPESFAVVDREYQAAHAEVTALQERLDTLNRDRRRVDGELSDQQETLKKYQGQLMQVKNQQQYAAAWKEIDATRKHVKDLEESVLKSMTEAEGVQGQLDALSAGHEALQQRYDAAHAEWQASLGDLRQEAEELKRKVSEAEKGVPPRLLNEFHRIYKQRQQVAVAPIVNETCSGCRTRIRPALSQQIRRGDLVYCEGCHRVLYLERPAS